MFSRDIFSSATADISDGNVIKLIICFNDNMNVTEAALLNIFMKNGWNEKYVINLIC